MIRSPRRTKLDRPLILSFLGTSAAAVAFALAAQSAPAGAAYTMMGSPGPP